MTKKHNVKHLRSQSHYKDRLEKRGIDRAPQSHFKLSDGKPSDAKR